MRFKSNKINKLIIILFVLGFLISLFLLYKLPESVEQISLSISPDAIKEASPVFIRASIVTIVTMVLGLISIILSQKSTVKKEVVEKVVYINESDNKETGENGDAEKINEKKIIDSISEAIRQKKTAQSKFNTVLSTLCNKLEASQGLMYQTKKDGKMKKLELICSFAFSLPETETLSYEFGEGLAGQAAKEKKSMKIDEIPEGYMTIISGLGSGSPNHLIIKPIVIGGDVEALVEIASFKAFGEKEEDLIDNAVKLLESELKKKEVKTESKKPAKKTGKNAGKKQNDKV